MCMLPLGDSGWVVLSLLTALAEIAIGLLLLLGGQHALALGASLALSLCVQ